VRKKERKSGPGRGRERKEKKRRSLAHGKMDRPMRKRRKRREEGKSGARAQHVRCGEENV